jgi:septum formation protein
MSGHPPLVLASASPRRQELLRQIGIDPVIVLPSEIDETPRRNEAPAAYARRMAEAKLQAALQQDRNCFVIAADTVVACGRRILPRADDIDTARRCLRLLSGRRHRVLGAVAVAGPDGRRAGRLVTTSVRFKLLTESEIETYAAGGEWRGKAGGYAIQGRAAIFVRSLSGSYSNVVGLPLFETHALLAGLGFRPRC